MTKNTQSKSKSAPKKPQAKKAPAASKKKGKRDPLKDIDALALACEGAFNDAQRDAVNTAQRGALNFNILAVLADILKAKGLVTDSDIEETTKRLAAVGKKHRDDSIAEARLAQEEKRDARPVSRPEGPLDSIIKVLTDATGNANPNALTNPEQA